uniref:Thioredoxin domain-containing protein n=2 Tax=Eukaryota TaxID=2759 RepID=A0A7S1T1J1_9CHLO|mmetsp:Transcript_39659/g.71159  ORF Transcript_39659/g.71159 Transcript_39659/m.71159 type:complete len:166 (+) Transcript_39659:293-790(+)
MKPDWDKLGKHYADSDSVLIVDVDCTAAGQGVCQKMGVKGYPTIKYFMAGDKKGKDYQGGRDFASLKGFAEKTLNKASCNAVTKNGCKANEVAFIEKHEGKSVDEIKAEVVSKAEELAALKKEKREAEKAYKEQEKEYKRKELLLTKASAILKQMEKHAGKKTEL